MTKLIINGLLVIYNPNISLLISNIESILPQLNNLLIYDNNSTDIEELKKYVKDISNIKLIENKINLGLSKCYNSGVDYFSDKFDFILLMDQDSKFSSNYVANLIENYNENIGILIGNYIDTGFKQDISNVKFAINSGSLLSKSLFQNGLRYDESLFLDLVDIDFSIRTKIKKFLIKNVNSSKYSHQIGEGNNTKTYNHNHFRKYTISKNTILLAKKYEKYKFDEFGFNFIKHIKFDIENKFYTNLIVAILRNTKRILIILLYENKKMIKIYSVIKSYKFIFRRN